jgi:predicted Zn-dependent protease with MMP-like domain
MDMKRFRRLVAQTIDMLPEEFRNAIENIEVVVEDWPTDEELDYFEDREGLAEGDGDDLLLGLYQGIPLRERDSSTYHGVLPDRITLYRKAIEEFCGGDETTMIEEIRKTFLHEVGHYFGIDEERLKTLGY